MRTSINFHFRPEEKELGPIPPSVNLCMPLVAPLQQMVLVICVFVYLCICVSDVFAYLCICGCQELAVARAGSLVTADGGGGSHSANHCCSDHTSSRI